MARRFYTIDDLYRFCKENHYETFSAEKQGAPLIIQSVGMFEAANNIADGLMTVNLKSCHTGKNRNKSGISDETMELYKDSFKGRPILGAIYKTDTGEYEFRGHDMEIVEDGDGVDIHYIEQPIGVISQTATPYLEFDEDEQKNYLMVEGTIFADYSKAAEILERRRTCKCSVEIAVEEMSYNCAEDYLSIDKFHFIGVTILGYQQDGTTEIQEGMAGSKITIDDFSAKHNSIFTTNYEEKMIEVLDKLNTTLSNFNKDTIQKGGNEMNKFEELLAKYGKTVEDIDFEYSNMTDEELEAKFAELFDGEGDSGEGASDSGSGDTSTSDPEGDNVVVDTDADTDEDPVAEVPEDNEDGTDGEDVDGNGEVGEDDAAPSQKKKIETSELKYELSHDDIRYALYNLLGAMSDDGYYNVWIAEVYDDKFIYENYAEGKCYRQKYSKDGDNVEFVGESIEVFSEWLSKEEKEALDALKADYSALKSFKEQYDADELKAQKDAVLESVEYAEIADSDEFKALVADAEQYSVEEIKVKADLLFAASMKKKFSFEAAKPENKHSVGININAKTSKKKQAYAGLFADHD